jgi:hypothetical protein
MAEAKNKTDQEMDALVGRKQKQTGENAHDDDENSRDRGLAPVRPSHLVGFLPDVLQKMIRIGHGLKSRGLARLPVQIAGTNPG